jgi:hypothetical protein
VREDPFFQHQLHRRGEHDRFNVSARLRHGGVLVAVVHRDDALSNDRFGVELVRDDMRGRPI